MFVVPAAPRPATPALARICNSRFNAIALHRSTRLRSAAVICSTTASVPIGARNRLPATHAPRPRRSNRHSARGAATRSQIAVSSLAGFLTPAANICGIVRQRPASETLHKRRRAHLEHMFSGLRPKADLGRGSPPGCLRYCDRPSGRESPRYRRPGAVPCRVQVGPRRRPRAVRRDRARWPGAAQVVMVSSAR